MPFHSIYVAATSQHVGKTTSTLGLVHTLKEHGVNVGYCKPVGQMYVDIKGQRIDKDAALFAQFMNFEVKPEIHSPIILGHGDTVDYLDNPQSFDLPGKLRYAEEVLNSQHDIVVYEGTGHPGVGSVADVSNSVVAQMVQAGVIMIVEAGIGSTIDKLDLNLAAFEQRNIPVIGVIINKTRMEKMEKVRHYVSKKMGQRGVRVLGVLPYEEELGLPLMETIRKAVRGEVLYNEDQFDNRVKDIIAGSLVDLDTRRRLKNQLLVVSVNRFDEAWRKVRQVADTNGLQEPILSGILLTGKGSIKDEYISYIQHYKIPVIRAFIDTYEAVIKISQIEVKINTRTPWKVQKAVDLFHQYVDLTPILDRIDKLK